MDEFRQQIGRLINHHSMENGSGTPDFLLAEYLTDCLAAFDKAVTARGRWYGRGPAAELEVHALGHSGAGSPAGDKP